MKDFFSNLLRLFQIIFVLFIPIAIIQFYFPQATFLGFIAPFSNAFISFFTTVFPQSDATSASIDFNILFVALPWIILTILFGILINIIEKMNSRIQQTITQINTVKTVIQVQQRENEKKTQLHDKNLVYMAIALVFSKFTISSLSEGEIEEKKNEIKQEVLKNISSFGGKVIHDNSLAFDDDDTFATIFFSQDDAINYIFKFKEMITFYDNTVQGFGYSVSFKTILDSQNSQASRLQVLSFMEKALNAVELGEICATNDFVDRYKQFGKLKQVTFCSKGNYMINKERAEINRLEY